MPIITKPSFLSPTYPEKNNGQKRTEHILSESTQQHKTTRINFNKNGVQEFTSVPTLIDEVGTTAIEISKLLYSGGVKKWRTVEIACRTTRKRRVSYFAHGPWCPSFSGCISAARERAIGRLRKCSAHHWHASFSYTPVNLDMEHNYFPVQKITNHVFANY